MIVTGSHRSSGVARDGREGRGSSGSVVRTIRPRCCRIELVQVAGARCDPIDRIAQIRRATREVDVDLRWQTQHVLTAAMSWRSSPSSYGRGTTMRKPPGSTISKDRRTAVLRWRCLVECRLRRSPGLARDLGDAAHCATSRSSSRTRREGRRSPASTARCCRAGRGGCASRARVEWASAQS